MGRRAPLIIFMGNLLFRDDRVGLIVGEKLRERLEREGYEVEIAEKVGLNLIDHLQGRDEVAIVDSVVAQGCRPGDVKEMELDQLDSFTLLSPHYVGVPETVRLMEALGLQPPARLHIIGICVSDVYTLSEEMSDELSGKIDEIAERVYSVISGKVGVERRTDYGRRPASD